MGASSSKEQEQIEQIGEDASWEQREQEAAAASTGLLPILRDAFSRLSLAGTPAVPRPALEEVFSMNLLKLLPESNFVPRHFLELLANLGPSIVDMFCHEGDSEVPWVGFLRGYNRCCGRMPVSISLNILLRVYYAAIKKTQYPINLDFDSNEDDSKISGSIKLNEVLMLLWMCWILEYSSRMTTFSKEKPIIVLPNISELVTSAFVSCNDAGDDFSVMGRNVFDIDRDIPVHTLLMWIQTTIPSLADCIGQYVLVRLKSSAGSEVCSDGDVSVEAPDTRILSCGRAWAISLALKSATNELLEACFTKEGTQADDKVLYRSSIHGKGLSRFWFNVEGYHGPLLILVSATLTTTSGSDNRCTQWILGILTGQGIENKDAFYGKSGFLFALSPIFHVFPASGKDKNFMYCHLRPTVRVYDPNPKPIGLAFGGTVGNERIFIDEDFARIIIRHHAVDKTYQPGCLFPNQGFLATEASIVDVEVWGLGGESAKKHQDAYKKRESIFSEQRRKVDLKTFGSWEDSPEKMMLDMVSNPNKVQREDR